MAASISCGSCKGKHESVAEVKACFEKGRGGGRPASQAQLNYAHMLYRERMPLDWQAQDEEQARNDINDMDFYDISEYIEKMKTQPSRPKAEKPVVNREPVPDGMYKTPDGTIYKVQIAVHGSGRPYAKKLIVDKEERDDEGIYVAYFEYDSAGLRHCTPENRMSLDEAKEFGHLYGICCKCGRTLTDETSIANGIGPICASKGW